jgi:hypothetical protein
MNELNCDVVCVVIQYLPANDIVNFLKIVKLKSKIENIGLDNYTLLEYLFLIESENFRLYRQLKDKGVNPLRETNNGERLFDIVIYNYDCKFISESSFCKICDIFFPQMRKYKYNCLEFYKEKIYNTKMNRNFVIKI